MVLVRSSGDLCCIKPQSFRMLPIDHILHIAQNKKTPSNAVSRGRCGGHGIGGGFGPRDTLCMTCVHCNDLHVVVVVGALAVMVVVGVTVAVIVFSTSGAFRNDCRIAVSCFPWSSCLFCSFDHFVLHICVCVACSSTYSCFLFPVILLLFSSLVYSLFSSFIFCLLPLSFLFSSTYMDSIYSSLLRWCWCWCWCCCCCCCCCCSSSSSSCCVR